MAGVTVTNHLPQLAAMLPKAAAAAVGEIANEIAREARQRASSRIERTIVVDHADDALEATVGAGDKSGAIHAGFEEFGTIGRAAHPFLIPAVEAVRPKVAKIAAKHIEQAARRSAV